MVDAECRAAFRSKCSLELLVALRLQKRYVYKLGRLVGDSYGELWMVECMS